MTEIKMPIKNLFLMAYFLSPLHDLNFGTLSFLYPLWSSLSFSNGWFLTACIWPLIVLCPFPSCHLQTVPPTVGARSDERRQRTRSSATLTFLLVFHLYSSSFFHLRSLLLLEEINDRFLWQDQRYELQKENQYENKEELLIEIK